MFKRTLSHVGKTMVSTSSFFKEPARVTERACPHEVHEAEMEKFYAEKMQNPGKQTTWTSWSIEQSLRIADDGYDPKASAKLVAICSRR